MQKLLTHMNGGTVEIFLCAECGDSQEKVPVHVTGWTEKFCSLQCTKDFFHNFNTRAKYNVH